MIEVPQVRLVGPEGEMGGVVDIRTALDMATQAGLDLVEVERARVMVMRTQLAGGRQWTQRCEGVTEKEASFGVGR